MRTYDKIKHSGVHWIGEIPEHWQVKRLKYVAKVFPSNVDKKSKEDEEEVLLCNYMDVYKNDYINSTIEFMNATASDAQIKNFKLNKGDVLATKDSETPDDIAVAAYVEEDFNNVICGYHLTHIKPNGKNLVGLFLFRLLQSKNYSQYFTTLARGVTRYALNTSAFSEMPTIVPPIKEQIAIANYLVTKTTEIDQTIADKEALINLFEEEKKALINEAVTKGLNPKVKLKPSGIDWLGDIPEHWEVKKLKYVMQSLDSKRVPLSSEERGDMADRIYDYYGASGIIDKVENYIFDEPLLLVGEDGANLLSRSTRLVFIAKGKYWVNNHAHILKPTFGLLEFYCEILELCDFSVWVTGSAQPKLTAENLMNIELAVPSIKEQNSIVNYIEKETVNIDEKINLTKREIELLKEFKQALIFEAVTGKICVL
jgi:type I restriction enzyme S subunit